MLEDGTWQPMLLPGKPCQVLPWPKENGKCLEQLESCQEQRGALRAMTLTLTMQTVTLQLQGAKEKRFSLALRMNQPLKSSKVQFEKGNLQCRVCYNLRSTTACSWKSQTAAPHTLRRTYQKMRQVDGSTQCIGKLCSLKLPLGKVQFKTYKVQGLILTNCMSHQLAWFVPQRGAACLFSLGKTKHFQEDFPVSAAYCMWLSHTGSKTHFATLLCNQNFKPKACKSLNACLFLWKSFSTARLLSRAQL